MALLHAEVKARSQRRAPRAIATCFYALSFQWSDRPSPQPLGLSSVFAPAEYTSVSRLRDLPQCDNPAQILRAPLLRSSPAWGFRGHKHTLPSPLRGNLHSDKLGLNRATPLPVFVVVSGSTPKANPIPRFGAPNLRKWWVHLKVKSLYPELAPLQSKRVVAVRQKEYLAIALPVRSSQSSPRLTRPTAHLLVTTAATSFDQDNAPRDRHCGTDQDGDERSRYPDRPNNQVIRRPIKRCQRCINGACGNVGCTIADTDHQAN